MFTWLATRDRIVAASKAHLPWIRETCISPPTPPWALSIAVSGQKQLLYLGVVNHDPGRCVVTLEGRRVDYDRESFRAALDDATLIAGVCGRPPLEAKPTLSHRFQLHEVFGERGAELADWWERSLGDPLFALVSYVCPSKKEQNETGERAAAADDHDD